MTISQAKEYYISMGCSLFSMAREDTNKYSEYKELYIPKDTEYVWKLEWVKHCNNSLLDTQNIGNMYGKMCEVAEETRDANILEMLYETLEAIKEKLTEKDMLIICETINGRKALRERSGLIYWAYDIGKKDVAQNFLFVEMDFLCKIQNTDLMKRSTSCYRICVVISSELGLKSGENQQ